MVVHISRLGRDNLLHEYSVDTQRLLPWPVLNAPFELSYAVCRANTVSKLHTHHEQEIFVAVSGRVEVECGGERQPFAAGDVCYFTPGQLHRVHNHSNEDFVFTSIWWDPEMAHRFLAEYAGSETERLAAAAREQETENAATAAAIEKSEREGVSA
ncbi:cupin domain-containing protein [Kribbella solani]|uniref:cupin domain-containing protein n=1 Tax=Kribbella solani TaxID=236067 RepID=UPI0029A7D7BA|nr:cupin domain-containing protein [Kribbella solani]MDX2970019.1 cupin domain-containing protein [Kribbella solani]MDX3001897.1 cupin domain-containing protein [Kribbella solani]